MALSVAQWAALAPQISFWMACGFFETLSYFSLLSQYRILPPDADKKNRVSKLAVVKYMIVNHTLTSIFLLVLADHIPSKPFAALPTFATLFDNALVLQKHPILKDRAAKLVRVAYLVARQLIAVVVLDGWQFWCHYTMHKVPWLYRNIHAVHHKLYAPYSYGALYNHWAESLVADDIGAVLGVTVAGLTDWEQVVFYSWIVAKTVEDHSGYALPFSPGVILAHWAGGGVVYHNVHHQPWGLKTNFQVYFTYWDRFMNTAYNGGRELIERPGKLSYAAASTTENNAQSSVVSRLNAASLSAGRSTPRYRLAKAIDGLGLDTPDTLSIQFSLTADFPDSGLLTPPESATTLATAI